jgi:competence protein ComEC
MLDDNGLGLIDVLKVGHHGSRTSSTEEFIASVQPLFAVISVGLDNSYGHPHPTVMERFEQHHITVWRTDRDGLVTFHSNGKRLRIETGRDLSTAGPQLLNAF